MIFLRTEGGNPYGGEGIVEGGKDPGGHYAESIHNPCPEGAVVHLFLV